MSIDIKKMSDKELENFLDKLAAEEYFKIEENQKNKSLNYFKKTIIGFEAFSIIDTDNIEPLNYPIENLDFHLRSDKNVYEFNSYQDKKWLDSKDHNEQNYIEVKYEK